MKKIFLLAIYSCFWGLLTAQVKPKTAPVIKQTQVVNPDTGKVINKQVPAVSGIKRALPNTMNENLVFYKWKATRWAHNSLGDFTLSAPNFTFNANGTVSCEGSIFSLGDNQLVNGTYTINSNNVIIIIKKDSSAIMTCNLTYDKVTKNLNGIYSNNILLGYAAGNNAQGDMKLEINQ